MMTTSLNETLLRLLRVCYILDDVRVIYRKHFSYVWF